jgi:hypothetical protein
VKHTVKDAKRASTLSARIGGAVGVLFVLGLLLATSASAGFEQVGTFADSGEGQQLRGATALAVNTSGAGGVPAGTIYGVGDSGNLVARYTAKGEFRAAWGWGIAVQGGKKYERCGPDGEPAQPVCPAKAHGDGGTLLNPGEGVGQISSPKGIAVDQTTGNVYVLSTPGPVRMHNLIQVFSPDGSQVIAGFGDVGAENETFQEGPEKLHNVSFSGIVVDDSGTVYVSDFADKGGHRVMSFKPQSPGDYEHYVYTGLANDIPAGGDSRLALDYAGNLYTTNNEEILEFNLADPTTPICKYEVSDGGLGGMTVNPANGEVFYFDFKNKKIHQLSACNAQGEFEETGTITPLPKTDEIFALAFNSALAWEASRPASILYAAKGGLGQGYIFAPAEVRLPVVDSESVSSVTATTATLGAQINPKGSTVHYAFQYIAKDAYEANEPTDRFAGATEAPLGGATLPASQEGLSAAASLTGLVPDTEYHYRVIATSHCEPEHEENLCEDIGDDQAFRTFPLEAPGLPDNRTWELVTPAQKNGGEVFPLEPDTGSGVRCPSAEGGCKPGTVATRFPKQSSPGGDAVVYEGFPFSYTEGAVRFNEYISKRTASGWQTTILPPALMSGEGAYKAFDAELTRGVLFQDSPSLTPDAPSEFANLYTQPTSDPSALTPLLGSEPPNRSSGGVSANRLGLKYAGAADDFSRQFFAANDALTPETTFAPEAVDGGTFKYDLYESVDGQLRLVNVLPGNTEAVPGAFFGSAGSTDGPRAISADGSRVFWSDEAGQVYVRIDGESTIAIPDPGKYLTASEDGSKVLLGNGHIYDLQTEATTDLSEGQGGFLGVSGQSEDLSRIYFVDTAVLSGEEENERGAKAQAGKPNLYAWQGGESTFVATLIPAGGDSVDTADWSLLPQARTAEASPDGRWLAFLSKAPLTGYDNVGPTCARNNFGKYIPAPCDEAFLYDSASGELRCASCNPSGVRPLGSTGLPGIFGGGNLYLAQPRYLTDSGRLYFDSHDSLTPFDTNRGLEGIGVNGVVSGAGEAGAEDVYQYEPEGVGSCKREEGCISLLSAGHESLDSNFQSLDASGKNVFFTTRDQLVLKDRDDLFDLYVAREGGGIGSETEVARGECQGEACQPAISPPNDPTPGSSTFEGAGNVDEKKATKKHKKKHKHAKKHKSHKRSHGKANNNRGGAK